MRSYVKPGVAVMVAALALAGCSSDVTTAPQPLTVSIVGLPNTLAAGDIVVFQVRVQDADGNDIPEPALTLASSNPAVALLDGSGRVRAVTAGAATIRASVGGVTGSAPVVVTPGPAVFELRQFGGADLPLFLEGDSVALGNGVVEFRGLYLDSGSLTLSGGAQPTYQTALHYASYAETHDDAGQPHLELRAVFHARDQGFVTYDARGDLTFTSLIPSLIESATAEADGFHVLYRYSSGDGVPVPTLFTRPPTQELR